MYQFRSFAFALFLSLGALLTSSDATAQDVPARYPMLELFTNTLCSICGSQDPGFFNRLAAYEGQYHHVSFYPGTPYPSCVFYQHNTSENVARKDFYPQVFGTPDVALNGLEFKSPASVTNAVLDALTGMTSWLSVEVDETSGSTRDVTITLQNHAGSVPEPGTLFAVVVEREIMYNAPNGINLHHNVFRKFLTPVDGEAVDLSSDLATRNYQYTVDNEWQADEVYVVAWFMDPDTKEIFNSGTRFDPVVSGTRDLISRVPLTIYPNPASDHINVDLPESAEGVLRIYHSDGRLISEATVHAGNGKNIDISVWPAGNYFVRFHTKDALMTGRFEVTR